MAERFDYMDKYGKDLGRLLGISGFPALVTKIRNLKGEDRTFAGVEVRRIQEVARKKRIVPSDDSTVKKIRDIGNKAAHRQGIKRKQGERQVELLDDMLRSIVNSKLAGKSKIAKESNSGKTFLHSSAANMTNNNSQKSPSAKAKSSARAPIQKQDSKNTEKPVQKQNSKTKARQVNSSTQKPKVKSIPQLIPTPKRQFFVVLAKGKQYKIYQDSFTLGRDICSNSDLKNLLTKNTGVSRKHLTIKRTGDEILIKDHSSTNGTVANGDKISGVFSTRVKLPAKIQLGNKNTTGVEIEVRNG
jgi:hypothetical protein